jgi:2-polyprenyl-6-hydroxyphenyl methylase/3-demethylubiquinone-9 3-methyltransferase
MDAAAPAFRDDTFDAVVCIQNGICAFGVDRTRLVREAVRVTRPGGRVLFSSYSDRFWPHRLEWFRRQAEWRLIGEIDEEATGDGVIVCRDGLRLERMRPEDFRAICKTIGIDPLITEVDGSSLFCELTVPVHTR